MSSLLSGFRRFQACALGAWSTAVGEQAVSLEVCDSRCGYAAMELGGVREQTLGSLRSGSVLDGTFSGVTYYYL